VTPETIAHYKITSKLGEGGMGEVWRATDTKLGREVAIKILPEAFAQSAERLARFTNEARILASLNHPNIAAIYGVEERALIMELVEGPTLAERIGEGPVPVEEALPIARQMAEALEYAHERGVAHRDLKPGNVKVTGPVTGTDGRVKVLDFGLAKAVAAGASSSDSFSASRVETETMTGVIVGTPAYMSPEQAQGRPADRRSDIWSYGVVLVEMLTGKRPPLAALIADEADLSNLPEATPAGVRRMLRRCLERDPRQRLQAIGEARVAIEKALAGTSEEELPALPEKPWWKSWTAAAAAVLLVALAALSAIHFREKPAELPVVRFSLAPPEKTRFALTMSNSPVPAVLVSPDGRRVVFSASSPEGKSQLWVRPLDAMEAQPLPGTDGGTAGCWSPDGRSIAYWADGKLKKMEATGGPPLTLTDAQSLRGCSWNAEGDILFAPSAGSTLMRVAAAGGAAAPATKFDATRGENSHRFPWFLPDGRHFVFGAGTSTGDRQLETTRLGSLDSLDSKVLLEADTNATYSQGYLLFLRDTTLMAQPFDAKRLALAGEARPLAEHVSHHYSIRSSLYGDFSASGNGLLVYRSGTALSNLRLTWVDRGGKRLSTVGNAANLGRMQLSPDRKNAAVEATDGNNVDIWIYDLARGLRTRFTFDPATDRNPVWSPDGRAIAFSSNRKGHYDLYRKAADGTGSEEPLYADGLEKTPTSWSADGKFLLFGTGGDPKTGTDLWVLPLAAGAKPYPLLQTPFNEGNGQFSPDGRWVSYQSNESGQNEVYVIPFGPGGGAPGGKRQISTAGGVLPRWRRDGKELFYIAEDQKLMAAEVSARSGSFEVGKVDALFGSMMMGLGFLYDAAPDGQRFLAVLPPEQNTEVEGLVVVQNWVAGLRK
jgi:serine/threonine protein kinase/dipeptidyl aminopeptidase/acylaminoacyl peptidase